MTQSTHNHLSSPGVASCCSVVAAWAGDSRAVVGSVQSGGSYTATQLTKDHKPNNLSEMARIMAAGGKVARPSTDRSGKPVGEWPGGGGAGCGRSGHSGGACIAGTGTGWHMAVLLRSWA